MSEANGVTKFMVTVATSDGLTSLVHFMYDDVLSSLDLAVGTGVVIRPSVDPAKHKVSSMFGTIVRV